MAVDEEGRSREPEKAVIPDRHVLWAAWQTAPPRWPDHLRGLWHRQREALAVEWCVGSGPQSLVKEKDKRTYSTVTLLARFLGLSTSQPRRTAM